MLTPEIISSVKRTFSRSKFAINFKNKAVVKGVKGKRGGKIVKCNLCGCHTPSYKANIDHIDAVVPVCIPGKYMAFILLYRRTFCDESNLQILCLDCHKNIKSKKERAERLKWRKKEKILLVRHTQGVRLQILKITNMKEFPEDFEILGVFKNMKDANKELRRIKKL